MIHTQKKKNKFFTFMFSIVPGAAEMYMGFLRNGLSMLILCMIPILLCAIFGEEIFLIPIAIVWIYGFFHAWNIAGLDDEDFYACRDVYIWEEFADGRDIALPEDKIKKILPVALLIVGFGVVWNYVFSIVIKFIPGDYWNMLYPGIKGVPGVVLAIFFIILGFRLLKKKKENIYTEREIPIYIESKERINIESKEQVDTVNEEPGDAQSDEQTIAENDETATESDETVSESNETAAENEEKADESGAQGEKED